MWLKKATKYLQEDAKVSDSIDSYIAEQNAKRKTQKLYTKAEVEGIRKDYENEIRDKDALIVELHKTIEKKISLLNSVKKVIGDISEIL